MLDLGPLHHFLGITGSRDKHGFFLRQSQIMLERYFSVPQTLTHPVDTSLKLSVLDGSLLSNGTLHRSLAGVLHYLTFTRPDISHAIQQILFMHAP